MLAWIQKPSHLLLVALALVPLAITFRFYQTEAGNVPYADQWCDAVPMVIEASDGEMAPWRPFAQHNVHRIVTASTFTLVNRYLTGWNLKHEILLNFALAGVNLGVLLWALRRYEGVRGEWLLVAAVLMSALIFTVRARAIWMWSYSSPYIVLYTLALVGALILVRAKPGPGPLVAALALNVVALWSIGSGVVSLLLVPVGLWLTGYRRWWHYAAWVGAVGLGFWVFFYQFNTTDPNFCLGYQSVLENSETLLRRLLALPGHITRSLGGVLLPGRLSDAGRLHPMGQWLAGLLLLNGLYMLWTWWRRREGRGLFVWMNVIGPGLGGVVLIGIGRTGYENLYSYLGSNYVYQAAMVLVGLVGLAVIASHTIQHKPQPALWERGLLSVNVLSVPLFLFFYYHAIAGSTNLEVFPHGDAANLHPSYEAEMCFRNFFFTEGHLQSPPACYLHLSTFADRNVTVNDYIQRTQRLAELRLTTFAEIVHRLPETYAMGEAVVVASELAAQQFPVITANGRRVPETTIVRVVGDASQVAPLERQRAVNVQVGTDIPANAPFWYFTPSNTPPARYSVVLRDWQSDEREPHDLLPMRLGPPLRPEAERRPPIDYGDALRLVDWQLVGDVNQRACGTLALATWWVVRGDAPLASDLTYASVAVAPDDPDNILFQVDLGLNRFMGTSEWEPGVLYYDRRQLDIPCDAQAGEYALLGIVYDYRTPDRPLPASTNADGAAYLTTLFIQNDAPQ